MNLHTKQDTIPYDAYHSLCVSVATTRCHSWGGGWIGPEMNKLDRCPMITPDVTSTGWGKGVGVPTTWFIPWGMWRTYHPDRMPYRHLLETCPNLFTWGPTPNRYWQLVTVTETRTTCTRAVRILLQCCLVLIITYRQFIPWFKISAKIKVSNTCAIYSIYLMKWLKRQT